VVAANHKEFVCDDGDGGVSDDVRVHGSAFHNEVDKLGKILVAGFSAHLKEWVSPVEVEEGCIPRVADDIGIKPGESQGLFRFRQHLGKEA
jgi:hypothetical protein